MPQILLAIAVIGTVAYALWTQGLKVLSRSYEAEKTVYVELTNYRGYTVEVRTKHDKVWLGKMKKGDPPKRFPLYFYKGEQTVRVSYCVPVTGVVLVRKDFDRNGDVVATWNRGDPEP